MNNSKKIISAALIAAMAVSGAALTTGADAYAAGSRQAYAACGAMDGEQKTLTEEEKAAMLEKQTERLDAKLSAGTITQEEYDTALAAIKSGDFSVLGKHGAKAGRGEGCGMKKSTKPTTVTGTTV